MKSMITLLLAFSLNSFVQAQTPVFEFIGPISTSQFRKIYARASNRLEIFYSNNFRKRQILVAGLIKRVEVYADKADFDKKLIQISNGQMTSVPKSFVGFAEEGVLRVVSWSEYKKIQPQDSLVDYEKLLTHEMAHQLHIELLNGDENSMGPVWFFEGFAVLAANQYPEAALFDREQLKEIIQNPNRGDYKGYGILFRELIRFKAPSEWVEMAKSSDFESQVLDLLCQPN